MIRRDRFLLAILGGIVLLIVLALVLFFARQGTLAYGPEDTPGGVVQNYMVALSLKDYDRAFRYVAGPPSPADITQAPGLPDAARFRQFFVSEAANQMVNTGLQIGDASVIGDLATVQVTLLHTSGSLFNAVGRDSQQFLLTRQNGAWRIYQGAYPFWNFSWSANAAPAKPAPPPASP